MDAETIEYGKPYVEENPTKIISGVLEQIVSVDFLSHSTSVPGSSGDVSKIRTRFIIKHAGLKETFEFPGFIGSELVGKRVIYSKRERTTKTYFNPKGRENDPTYRVGKIEEERITSIAPESITQHQELPSYRFIESSMTSM